MDREFKFRFWNNNDKTMEHETTVENGWGIGMNGCFRDLTEFGIVIMQYTGIKDRKGNLIFEGDVLENKKYGNKCYVAWGAKDLSYCGFVTIRIGEKHILGDLLYFSDKENLEVIGNIHQHPELIQCPKT